MKRLHIFSFVAVFGPAFVLSACAPQQACLDLEVVRGTAVDALGVEGPACLRQDEVTLRFESATWADLQDQAREITGDPTLSLSMAAIDLEPNQPEPDERLVFLVDNWGRLHGFESSTQMLRVIQPSTLVRPEPGQEISVETLRTRAKAYAATYAPVVLADGEQWAYNEGVKDPIHFFDWTATTPVSPSHNPNRFLVALLSDGQLFSYVNYVPADD